MTGLGTLLRFTLRRERVRIPVYVLVLVCADRLDGGAERAALPDRRLARRLRRDGREQPGPDRDGRAAASGDQRRR